MQSLAASLAHVGKNLPFRIRNGFQTHPNSLREMIRIMNLPKPDLGQLENRLVHEFSVNDAQGLAYAFGDTWYLTSQWQVFQFRIEGQDLYRPTATQQVKSVHLTDLIASTGLNTDDYDHIGDVAYFKDILFVPVRHAPKKTFVIPGDPADLITCPPMEVQKRVAEPPHLLLALSKELEVVWFADVLESFDFWCAINPWDETLYMPDNKDAQSLNVYEISNLLDILSRKNEWGRRQVLKRLQNKTFTLLKENGDIDTSGGFQGCFFSTNGRMYLPRAASYSTGWHNYLHVYETLTGARLGVSQEYDFPATWDEIEGVSIHPSGVIYIAVADNDYPSTDEFWVYAFRFSNSNLPV